MTQSAPTPNRPYRALFWKASTFAAVGLVNATIDFAVFWSAVQTLGTPKILANLLSWTVAVTASYTMNTMFTFAAETGRRLRWRSYFTFAASGIVGLVGNTTALLVGDWVLRFMLDNENWRLALAKIGSIGVSFVINFSMSHFIVFRPRPADRQV